MTPWQQKVYEYRDAGFTPDQIAEEAARKRAEYVSAGFTQDQIDEYFGSFEQPDRYRGIDAFVEERLKPQEGSAADPRMQPARSLTEMFEAGFDQSAVGLLGSKPDRMLPETANALDRLVYGAGLLAGDLPFSLAGGAAAGAAGYSAGPAGMAIGAGAGGAALPEAVRQVMFDHYEKGGVKDFPDLLRRAVHVAVETSKAAIVGAATGGAGAKVRAAAKGAGASAGLQTTAQLTAEAAAGLTTMHALEGRLPTMDSLTDAAVMVAASKAGLKAGDVTVKTYGAIERNLMRNWRDTGELPAAAAQRAGGDPAFRERMLLDDPTADSKETVVFDDGENQLTAVRRKALADETQGKEVSVDATGGMAPEDVVLGSFQRRGKRSLDDVLHTTYAELFNEAHPFNRMVDALVEGGGDKIKGDDAKALMEGTYYSTPKAELWMREGLAGVDGLDATLPRNPAEFREFAAYLGARHAEELHALGIANPVDRAASQAVLKKHAGKYEKRAQQFTAFNNAILDRLVEGGIVPADAALAWKARYKNYVPFNRVLDEEGFLGAGANKSVFNPKKAQKGSEKDIYDPIESTVRYAYMAAELVDRNAAIGAAIDLARSSPDVAKGWITAKPGKKVRFASDDPEQGDIIRTLKADIGRNDVLHFEDGKGTVYTLDPEVASFIKGMDRRDLGVIGSLLEVPNKLLRGGITLSPEFPVVQFFRDNPWQWITDPKSTVPFGEFVTGAMHMMAKSPEFKRWEAEGGPLSTIRSLGNMYDTRDFVKRYYERGTVWQGVRNAVTSPLQLLKVWSDFFANAPRVGTYVRALKAGESDVQALKQARDSQLNFKRNGAVARQINRIIPFFGPYLNGMDRMLRAQVDNPAMFTAKAAAIVTAPVLTAWAAYHNEEWYQELPEWQKDQSIPFRVGDTTYLIPLPPVLSVVYGGVPRRVAQALVDKDPRAMDHLVESLLTSATPAIAISAFAPIVEQIANYSFFKKKPLVPDSLKKALPQDQYTPYTTETAKKISQALSSAPIASGLNMSPIVVENYVRQWLGTLGRHALTAADEGLRAAGVAGTPNPPSPTLSDIPVISRFVARYPSASSRSIEIFYEDLKQYDRVLGSIRLTKDRIALDPAAGERLTELYREHQPDLAVLVQTREFLSQQRELAGLIEANPGIDSEDKRRLLDTIYSTMIMVARNANDVSARMKDALRATEESMK